MPCGLRLENLAGAPAIEVVLAQHLGFATALAAVASTVLFAGAIVIALGSERKGSDLQALS